MSGPAGVSSSPGCGSRVSSKHINSRSKHPGFFMVVLPYFSMQWFYFSDLDKHICTNYTFSCSQCKSTSPRAAKWAHCSPLLGAACIAQCRRKHGLAVAYLWQISCTSITHRKIFFPFYKNEEWFVFHVDTKRLPIIEALFCKTSALSFEDRSRLGKSIMGCLLKAMKDCGFTVKQYGDCRFTVTVTELEFKDSAQQVCSKLEEI